MPYLSFDSEYCELRFGANLLGGRGEGSVLLSVLASMPPTALILVSGDGRTTIRRLPSRFPIRVDGEILGSASMELLDNSHLEVGEHRLLFTLSSGDMVRIGDEDYRVENGSATRPPQSESQRATEFVQTVPVPTDEERPEPLASLEVTRGGLRGTHYSIERPVCAIGSSRANDLRLADPSVAPSHATLMLKGETWYVADLRSRHGTFVNGYRVATERALAPGCTITVGHVTLVFRARRSLPAPEPEQPEGWVTRFVKFLRAS